MPRHCHCFGIFASWLTSRMAEWAFRLSNHLSVQASFERWERIDGVIYDMSPSPSSQRQTILVNLVREISTYLKGMTCKLFTSLYDVYLNGDESGDYIIPYITRVVWVWQMTKQSRT